MNSLIINNYLPDLTENDLIYIKTQRVANTDQKQVVISFKKCFGLFGRKEVFRRFYLILPDKVVPLDIAKSLTLLEPILNSLDWDEKASYFQFSLK
jgi:hypothetical protein